MLKVEIIYALPDEQNVISLTVAEGTTIEQAIHISGILSTHPEIDVTKNTIGIYSQRQKLDYQLQDKDRIEIYRELIADPKEVRRKRAQKQREEGIIK